MDDEVVGDVPLLELVGVFWVIVLPCGVFEPAAVVPLLVPIGVPCVVVLP